MQIKLNGIKKLELKALTSRSLSLTMYNCSALEEREYFTVLDETIYTNTITKLKFHGTNNFEVCLGLPLVVDKVKYNVVEIIPGERINQYIIISSHLNISTKYLLPLVSNEKSTASNYLFNTCLDNCYMKCNKYPDLEKGKFLFVTYRFFNNAMYKKLETEITNQKNFVLADDSRQGFTTFILDISEAIYESVVLISTGKYSLLSPEIKSRIVSFYDPKRAGSTYKYQHKYVKDVLYVSEDRRQQLEKKLDIKLNEGCELESKPLLINETLEL